MTRLALLCIWVALTWTLAPPARAQSTRAYSVLLMGVKAGALTETLGADGVIEVDYSYRDNGRGPDLRERWNTDPAGIPIHLDSSGKSTYGAPIADVVRIDGGSATWSSVTEKGRRQIAAPAFYVPVEHSPALLARLAGAAARQGGGPLPLLPDGSARAERLRELQVGPLESRLRVALYAVTGLDIEPHYVWLRDDGDPDLFAWTYPGWLDVIADGYESDLARIKQAQDEAASAQLEQLARRLSHRFAEPILIRNARVFDAERAALGPAQDIYVVHGRIGAVYPAGSPARGTGTVIDAGGRVLLPGLFDMHVHEYPWTAVQELGGGVTTVRDMGNDNEALAALAQRIEDGRSLGARIVAAGYIEGESPFASRSGFVVSDPDQVRQAIDWYAQRGYPQIKIYNSFKPEWVRDAADYAHRRSLRVSGHVPAFMLAEQAIEQGYDEVQHVNQLLLNFFATPTTDTRTLERFSLVAEKAHALDLDGARVRDFIDLMVRRKTVIDPTLATFEPDFTQLQGEANPSFAAVEARYPIVYRRTMRTNPTDVNPGNVDRFRASYRKMVDFIGRCHRAGVPIEAGTDGPAGWLLHRELELYVQAGIPAAEVLRIATWNGAKYTGLLDRLGSVTRGKLADLVIVDGDPTRDISDIRRVVLTMKQGVVYYPAEIFEATGIEPLVPALRPLPLP